MTPLQAEPASLSPDIYDGSPTVGPKVSRIDPEYTHKDEEHPNPPASSSSPSDAP